jgi:hypothetical protein
MHFHGIHQLHESLLAQNGGILGGQPYRFHILFSENIQLQIAAIHRQRGMG